MNHKDEFSKWMETVEEALVKESDGMGINVIPDMNSCNCGSWNCPSCFPDEIESPTGEIGMIPQTEPMGMDGNACPMCGHEKTDDHMDHNDMGGEMDAGFKMPMENDLDEEDMEFEQEPPPEKPRSGNGVKLGDIVQKTEYRKVGQESPLTYGEDNLDEDPEYGYESGGSEPDSGMSGEESWDNDEMDEMENKIMYMQDMGLSKDSEYYTSGQLSGYTPEELKACYDRVMGTVSEGDMMPDQQQGMPAQTGGSMGGGMSSGSAGNGPYPPGTAPTMPESINRKGQTTMENIDTDIKTWLGRFKAYDELRNSKNPVMEKKVKEEGNPWEKLGADKDEEKKDNEKSTTAKGGTVTKTKTGLQHKAADKKDEVKESADQETLDWMKRFAKLGNMKGYGR